MEGRPTPDTPHSGKRCPPRAPSCGPNSAQSQLVRARAVGFVTGPHAHTPCTHSQWVAGPGCGPQGRAVGRGRAPNPGCLTRRQGAPPQGTLVPPQRHAKPARRSARCGVGRGSPHPDPPHPQPVGIGPRPQTPRTSCWAWESAQPQTSHTQARGAPPRAPSCCSNSAQSQLARARAVGEVAGPHTHSPRTNSQWVAGPGRTPGGRAVGRGRAPNPERHTLRKEAPPPGAFVPPQQRAKPARKSARPGVARGSPRPHSPHPQQVGSGPRPHAPRTSGRAWKSDEPRTTHIQARGAPPGALVPPP